MRLGGPIDLETTFTCGQIYHWWRDGEAFATTVGHGWLTAAATDDGGVLVETDGLDRDDVIAFLGLDHDLSAVLDDIAVDAAVERAVRRHRGLRLLSVDPFPCLVGFIASQRATVERTTAMVRRLCERHGRSHADHAAHAMPSPAQITDVGETGLRELGFGYRAPYVAGTAERIADGEVELDGLGGLEYREAKRRLKRLPGVGDKVADCVLLFGLGFRNVVALDTRIRGVIEEQYPELVGDGYEATACAFRERFSPHAGYAQTYLYHDASMR